MSQVTNSTILDKNQIHIESPSIQGNGYRMKIGDGVSTYEELPYCIGSPNMTFRNNEIIQTAGSNISNITTSSQTEISNDLLAINEDLAYITNNHTLGELIGTLKSSLSRLNIALYKLNEEKSNSGGVGSIINISGAPANTQINITVVTTLNNEDSTITYNFTTTSDSNGNATKIIDEVGEFSFVAGDYSATMTIEYFGNYSVELSL